MTLAPWHTPTRVALAGIALLVAALPGCGNDGTGPDPNPAPTGIAVSSGNNQTATVGSTLPLPLVVRVADAANQGLPGITVVWEVVQGGGTLSALTSVTDTGGLASVQYLLGSAAGTNRVRATVQGSTLTTTFDAVGTSTPPGGTP
jgi:ABC-type phosphate transport system substrate-binding protein